MLHPFLSPVGPPCMRPPWGHSFATTACLTYAVAGRQYLVTAAGGHGSFGTRITDDVIAPALEK